jgi:cell division protein FtsW
MLYSSSMSQSGSHYLIMQLIWCALGLGVCVFATCVDYRLLKKFAVPIYVIAVIALALVLEPSLGRKINGARRWFDFGGVRFQPSELGKLALIIALAWYAERYQRYMNTWSRGILPTGAIVAVVLGLIFVEPDRGTTILLAAVSGTMLLIAGVRWKHLVTLAIPGVLAVGYFQLRIRESTVVSPMSARIEKYSTRWLKIPVKPVDHSVIPEF